MQDSPREQFLRCAQLNAKVFDDGLAGLAVSFHFPGSSDYLQIPDGTDGTSPQDGPAAWQAQVRDPAGGDPAVVTTFLDGSVEVAEFLNPWIEGPLEWRSDERRLIFAPFDDDGSAESSVTADEFAAAVVRATRAALRRRAGRHEPCDCCGELTPEEQRWDTACLHCHEEFLQFGVEL